MPAAYLEIWSGHLCHLIGPKFPNTIIWIFIFILFYFILFLVLDHRIFGKKKGNFQFS